MCGAVLMAGMVPATAGTSSPSASDPSLAPGTRGVILGAVGDPQGMAANTHAPMAWHAYAKFTGSVPDARLITVNSDARWQEVAHAQPGSALYASIVRWANTLKARPGFVSLAYGHEPEMVANMGKGNASDFAQAFRRVVTIMRSHGATNVKYVWQMTAWSFRAPASDRMSASKWYPGDYYVDIVAADAYNWYTCGHGRGRWVELSTLTDPVIAFARAHGKQTALAEFAATPDYKRAQWLRNAHQYLAAHKSDMAMAFYFHREPTHLKNIACHWPLKTAAEYDAYGDIARDNATFIS